MTLNLYGFNDMGLIHEENIDRTTGENTSLWPYQEV